MLHRDESHRLHPRSASDPQNPQPPPRPRPRPSAPDRRPHGELTGWAQFTRSGSRAEVCLSQGVASVAGPDGAELPLSKAPSFVESALLPSPSALLSAPGRFRQPLPRPPVRVRHPGPHAGLRSGDGIPYNLNRWLAEATDASVSPPPVAFSELRLASPAGPAPAMAWAVEIVTVQGLTVRCRAPLAAQDLARLLRSLSC